MRVYLAGPEVFLADAESIGAAKRRICAAHGCVGIFPKDTAETAVDWFALYERLERTLRGCDALIANLTPFRGPSADVGTVFEMGLMRGLGRPVFGYANVEQGFAERTAAALTGALRPAPGGGWEDADGMAVESFDLFDNLMLPGGIQASGGTLILQTVPPEVRWRDLAAFERCVEAAMLPRRSPPGQFASESSA